MASNLTKQVLSLELPHGVLFKEAWEMWIQDRSMRKKPVTPIAAKLQLEKLSKVPEKVAIETIKTSIERGYQGVFPPEVPIIQKPQVTENKTLLRLEELHQRHRREKVSEETYVKLYDWLEGNKYLKLPEYTLNTLKSFYEGDKLKILTVKAWFDHLTETGKTVKSIFLD